MGATTTQIQAGGRLVSDTNRLPVASVPQQYSSAPSSSVILTEAGTVFTLAEGEKGFIQNLGINPLFVKRGASASSTSLHYILAGSAEQDDGTGEKVEVDDMVGPVSVAGTTPRFLAWKI